MTASPPIAIISCPNPKAGFKAIAFIGFATASFTPLGARKSLPRTFRILSSFASILWRPRFFAGLANFLLNLWIEAAGPLARAPVNFLLGFSL